MNATSSPKAINKHSMSAVLTARKITSDSIRMQLSFVRTRTFIVGIVGSFLGNIVAGLFGMGANLTTLDPIALLWAFIGAVILLGIVNLVRRGKVR